MRMQRHLRAPDDKSGGRSETFTSEEGKRTDRQLPAAKSGLPTRTPDTEQGGERISGPGPNDLTRGLP